MAGMHRAERPERRSPGLVIGLTMGLILAMSFPLMANDTEGPSKVWICHFEDNHNVDTNVFTDVWKGVLDGDWVLNYAEGMPLANQVSYCETKGGELKIVSVNAVGSDEDARGHRVQLAERIWGYPDGYKG